MPITAHFGRGSWRIAQYKNAELAKIHNEQPSQLGKTAKGAIIPLKNIP